jgi:DNA-binding CsgD family transcriptional regulator
MRGRIERVETLARSVVGRDPELALLEPLERGTARAVVVCGEAGIGKTAVWEAVLERHRIGGAAALVARPTEPEAQLAFAALSDLLGVVVEDVVAELSPPRARMLRVALLLEEPGGDPVSAVGVGLAVLDALRAVARARGRVLVAVDDAHWLDPGTAEALAFAMRRLGADEPILALLSRRADTETSLERSLAGAEVMRVELGPLSVGALSRIVHQRLGASVSLPLMRKIHDATRGNPFYAVELARQSLERGAFSLPRSVGALAEDRLSKLPRSTSLALLDVAALSDPVVGLVDLDLLDPAFATGVLELDGARVRFAHPLLRSAVYGSATPRERREAHRRLAQIVSGEERARHLGLATIEPSAEISAELELAARSVAARGAAWAAVELAELAVERAPAERRAACAVSAAECRLRAGDPAGARERLEALLVELDGELRARALVLLAWTREDDFELACRICEEALATTKDRSLAADAHVRLAEFALGEGKLTVAREHARDAVACAEAAGDVPLLVRALSYLAHFGTLTGALEVGVLERAIELERTLERPSAYYGPRAILGLRLMWQDRLSEARVELTHECARAASGGDEVARAALLVHLAQLETRAGDWGQARLIVEEAMLLSELLGLSQNRSASLSASAMLAALTGRVDDARTAARAGLHASRGAHEVVFAAQNAAALGFLELSLGDAAAADDHLRVLPDLYAAIGYGNPGANPFLPNAIEAAIATGDRVRARTLTEQLAERGAALDNHWAGATASRCRGLLAAAAGRPHEGRSALEQAIQQHARSQNPFERARTLLALGQLERRSGRRRAAREWLEQARALFTALGAPLWTERACAELASIGGRAPAGAALTAAELRVAVLVAEGRTNREVAAALVISERTVATHVTHVYGKLGVRSRTELAHQLAAAR